MNTAVRTPSHRARLGAVIASLIAVTAILSGCGAGGDYLYSESDASAEAPAMGNNDGAPVEGERVADTDRSIIVTGALYMTVDDPIAAADRAADIVRNAGGRIDARRETAPSGNYGGSASLTLRIPTAQLDATVDNLRELGEVDEFSTDSYDVTTEVIDLDARISTLRASTDRIESLLQDAERIADIIDLENELARRQAELESLQARQRGLGDQVSMSTISLSLTTEPVVIVDDSPQTFWDGLTTGWNAFVAFFSFALVVLGVLLPWIALITVIVFAIVIPIRLRSSYRARQAADAAAPAPKG